MRICHCLGVSDRSIRRAVHDEGATDLESVADVCGAGSVCGGCRPAVAEVMISCGVSVVAVSLRPSVRRSAPSVARPLQTTSAA